MDKVFQSHVHCRANTAVLRVSIYTHMSKPPPLSRRRWTFLSSKEHNPTTPSQCSQPQLRQAMPTSHYTPIHFLPPSSLLTRSHHVPPATSSRASAPSHPDPSLQVSKFRPKRKPVSQCTLSTSRLEFPSPKSSLPLTLPPLPLLIPNPPPHTPHPRPTPTALETKQTAQTHIILLPHIDPPPLTPDPQPLLLAHLAHLAVVLLVPERRRRRQEEGARHHGQQEGQPEGRERVLGQRHAVARRERVRGG